MLYANFDLLVKKDEQKNRFVFFGQQGENCRRVKVNVNKKFAGLHAHQLEKDFHFERNEHNKWVIATEKNICGGVHLILSSKLDCGSGRSYISQLCTMSRSRVIIRSNGIAKHQPYARLWETLVLSAFHGDVFRITWGTYNCSHVDTLYLVWRGNVYCSDLVRFDRLGERLGEMPNFPWRWEDDQLKINLRDWQVL